MSANHLARALRAPVGMRLLSGVGRKVICTISVYAAQPRAQWCGRSVGRDVHHGRRVTKSCRSLCTAAEPREVMEYDVLVVGGGPAGLAAAIRAKQLANQSGRELSVCVVEKGAELGAHILSGNVFETHALDELIPDWKEKGAPLNTKVTGDNFFVLNNNHSSLSVPHALLPKSLNNEKNYIISLGALVRWLGTQAEELGVEIYAGFAADEVLYRDDGSVRGIATRDVGIGKDGKRKDTFARGIELRARQTLLAEGCRGSCSEEVIGKMKLREGRAEQTYGIGLKEIWEIEPSKFRPGYVQHTVGWPLDSKTYGGSFMYHMEPNKVLIGFVIGLDYQNPYLSPYNEFQRWKTHPEVKKHLEGGKCISYGARALNEGGLQSMPKLTFPGGALIGCSAGFLNVAKIKGSHTAIKSGMLAAEAVVAALEQQSDTSVAGGAAAETFETVEPKPYQSALESSWVYKELHAVRNVRPSFHWGLLPGMLYSGFTLILTGGREPWTLKGPTVPDHLTTGRAADYKPIDYPKPDGVLTFDILTNLARSGVAHEGDQPAHLRVKPAAADWAAGRSYRDFAGPEGRFCPAKVYEYPEPAAGAGGETPQLVINAQNCVHCKTCDIKTPGNFIKWTVPEGSGGPQYQDM